MTRFILSLLLSLSVWTASSQKIYFVYIQAENAEPFFVRMNEKVFSSTGSGYLVLSKLRDSSYNFVIGFPQNKWPESKYSVFINKKDHGFLLKNFGEKGWGLFDLESLSVQMPVVALDNNSQGKKNEVSPFTEILSKAADDPSLKEKPVMPKPEEKKTVEAIVQDQPKKEESKPVMAEIKTVPSKPLTPDSVVEKKELVKSQPVESYQPSIVVRKSESSTTDGFGLVFVDQYPNGIKDTIRLLIPNPKGQVAEVKQVPNQVTKPETKPELKFLDINSDSSATAEKKLVDTMVNTPVDKSAGVKQVTQPALKNNCAAVADDADFFRLRRNMAGVPGEEDMVDEARKYFKTKCFSTLHIRNLGSLFLTDSGKYKFFDAAYSYASDPENFGSLQSELKDDYYINRFKAMLRANP